MIITPEKIKILLRKAFQEGCSGRGTFCKTVLEVPDYQAASALKWAAGDASVSQQYYSFEIPELLELLRKAFLEGQSSFQSFVEVIEYVVDALIASISSYLKQPKQPKKVSDGWEYYDYNKYKFITKNNFEYFSSIPTYTTTISSNYATGTSGFILENTNQYYYNINDNQYIIRSF